MINRPFIHLRTQSSYSLSEGAIKMDKLIDLAFENNMPAIALVDNNNMFGVLEFSIKCQKKGIQPIIGTSINIFEISHNNELAQVSFLVKNEIGYKNLLYLSSKSHTDQKKDIGVSITDIISHSEGLICFVGGEFNPLLFLDIQNKNTEIEEFISNFKEAFNNDFYFELQRIENILIDNFEHTFLKIAYNNDISIIASNNVKFEKSADYNAHDVLLCIAQKSIISHEKRKRSNPNIYFKSSKEMCALFNDIPEIINNNFNIALKCNYFPKEVLPRLPKFVNKSGISENDQLIKNAKEGLNEKIKSQHIKNTNQYIERLDYELKIINNMGYAGYFLIVEDFVKWAKNNSIPVGQGRGSGAGSLVAWSLTITDLDPLQYGLLFERFLNPERVSMPDFDIDFCQNRRNEVIDYVNKKYGRNSVAHIITFGTLASRAVVRDVGRVFEVPYSEVDQFAKIIPYNPANPLSLKDSINSDNNIKDYIKNDERITNIVDTSLKLEGLYRHASTHAGGVVISDEDLINNVPLYKDPNTAVYATQFSMNYVEKAGLIKFDFLGLTTLSIIQDTIKLITKIKPNFLLDEISMTDKKTFEQLSKGDAVGVFQLESAGMSNVLKQLQPDKFEEIIAVVALFRPGPMQNIPSFCNRKHKREKIDYFHPLLEPVLKETYGIIVYQEQVMQIAQILSNYSLGEADLLRRAMGKKIQKEMDAQKNRFIEGAKINNVNTDQASYIFDLVGKFAGYGFNKSHAAGYALLAYQTAYLKTNFPHEFMTASLNYAIDRTDRIILLKKELDKLNINIEKPDINYSNSLFSIENKNENQRSIRFALAAIKGVGVASMNKLVNNRSKLGKFNDIVDFLLRLDSEVVNKRQLEKLIQSGAFDSISKNRNKLFRNVEKFVQIFASSNKNIQNQNLLFEDTKVTFDDENLFEQNVLEWNSDLLLRNELEVIGFYFSNHPLNYYPINFFIENNIIDFEEIINSSHLKKANLVGTILDVKERSNREGKKYAFLTISNTKSQFELVIFSDNLKLYKNYLKEGNLLLFNVDISRNNENLRIIIRKVVNFDKYFNNKKLKFNLFLSNLSNIELLDDLITKKVRDNNSLFVFFRKDDKLLSLDFSRDYKISSYLMLNKLNEANKLDYSVEIQ